MTTVQKMMQLWEVVKTKKSLKVTKAITENDHEFLELKDEHDNKIEVKFFPDFYMKE